MAQEAPAEADRDEILEAALACFTDAGFEATSLDDIAERCGVPVAAVRERFADREAVRLALLSMWSERLSGWMGSA